MADDGQIAKPARLTWQRALRCVIALGLIGLALYTFGPGLIYREGSKAAINAHVIPLLAPIDGTVMQILAPGTAVAAGQQVARIEDASADTVRLAQLTAEVAALRERIAAEERLNARLDEFRTTLEDSGRKYHDARLERLNIQVSEARAAARSSAATAELARLQLDRGDALFRSGNTSGAQLDTLRAGASRARADADQAALVVQRLEAERAAVQNGIYVAEERNDVPYTQQRIDEIILRQADLNFRFRESMGKLAAAEAELGVERARTDRIAAADLRAPTPGIVWRTALAAGGRAARNAPIAMLIDCSRPLIITLLPERHFEDVGPGTRASVRVTGSRAPRGATVRERRGMGAAEGADRLAGPVPAVRRGEFLVTLELDEDGAAAGSGFCDVGRSAEVRFETGAATGREVALIERMQAWLGPVWLSVAAAAD
jgi:multidrug resistance efflux pump